MADRRIDGGGPWLLSDMADGPLPDGSAERYNLRRGTFRGQKGFFKPWLPLDTVLVKNLSDSSTLVVEYNGVHDAVVQPNATDTFDRIGVADVRVENRGPDEISRDEIIVQGIVEPYSADDSARASRKRSNVQNMIRGVFNL